MRLPRLAHALYASSLGEVGSEMVNRLPASVRVIRITFTIIRCSCGFGVWLKMLQQILVRRWCATCGWKSTEASKATPQAKKLRGRALCDATRWGRSGD